MSTQTAPALFRRENIRLHCAAESRAEAIRQTGRLLVEGGYVAEEYIESMVERDRDLSVYMGEGLAIPHCTGDGRRFIKHSGIVVLQFPDGVSFGGDTAHILVGIAGMGDDHLHLLQRVAATFMEAGGETLGKLFHTDDVNFVYALFA